MVIAIGFYQNGGIIETLHTASNGEGLKCLSLKCLSMCSAFYVEQIYLFS
ncbi:hypothetical protein Avbf_14423, partial [Armadillidium vulgare]